MSTCIRPVSNRHVHFSLPRQHHQLACALPLQGYFISSLPTWKDEGTMGPIAVLRMDGDMYESTMVGGSTALFRGCLRFSLHLAP